MVKRIRYRPFFMQTPERKEREREIVRRALRIACAEANYSTNICSWAYVALPLVDYMGNPRSVMKMIPEMIKEGIDNPNMRVPIFRLGLEVGDRDSRKKTIELALA